MSARHGAWKVGSAVDHGRQLLGPRVGIARQDAKDRAIDAKARVARKTGTQRVESLDDARALEVVQECLSVLRDEAGRQHGVVIKTIGDEVMCTFPSGDQAVETAIGMQERVNNELSSGGDAGSLSVRVGFHFGEVIRLEGDPSDDDVQIAEHVARVRAAIEGLFERGLAQRKAVFR